MLAALGWRLDELDDVQREYRFKSQDNPVDYALFLFGKPVLLIEAKALGCALDRKCASQVLYYANVAGIAWCVLTNGDEYRIYCSREMGDVDTKLFRSMRVTDTNTPDERLHTLALIAKDRMGGPPPDLDSLWRSEVVDRRVTAALQASVADDALLRVVRKKLPDIGLADLRESLGRIELVVRPQSGPPPESSTSDGQNHAALNSGHQATTAVSIAALIAAGLVAPPLVLEKTYKGITLTATIEPDSTISYLGKPYESLSAAGGEALRSARGDPEGKTPACNGWAFWHYADPMTGLLRPVDDLRQQYFHA